MKYNAIIEYTGNIERAGKLTLKSEDGNTILSKVPVAMPEEIFNVAEVFKNIYSTRSVQVKTDQELKKFDKSGEYNEAYKEIVKTNPEGIFIKNFGKVLIKPTTDKKMKNDVYALVMHKEHFEVLFEILAKKDLLEIETKKVSLLWFPEKVTHANGSINVTLSYFEKVESKIKNEKDDAERIIALESAQKKAKVNTGITKPKLIDALNNVAKIVSQDNKKSIPNVETPIKNQSNISKQSIIQVLPSKNTTTYRDDNNLDALDIVLMYSNPELAPFIKPNSSLAWFLYFNNRSNNMDKNYVEENIRNVQGFENIASSDFKYTPKGYSVTLFDDANKNNSIGRMDFDNQKNCYETVSNNGEKTLLSIGNNGQIESCFKSANGNETKMNLIQTDKGFVGNWESDNNGVKVNSGISFDNDFSYSSTPNKSVDMSLAQAVMINSAMNNDYSNKVNQTFEINQSPSVEREYTPPPPPPPRNNEVWGSGDPYSNGSSFRM